MSTIRHVFLETFSDYRGQFPSENIDGLVFDLLLNQSYLTNTSPPFLPAYAPKVFPAGLVRNWTLSDSRHHVEISPGG